MFALICTLSLMYYHGRRRRRWAAAARAKVKSGFTDGAAASRTASTQPASSHGAPSSDGHAAGGPKPEGNGSVHSSDLSRSAADAARLVDPEAPPTPTLASLERRPSLKCDDAPSIITAVAAWNEFRGYSRVRVLGRGSSGQAVLLRSPDGSRLVVSKQVVVEGMSAAKLAAVENEVVILRSLQHPNIIGYLACFHEQGELCIVTEYAESGTLASRIAEHAERRAHFSSGEVLLWLSQLASALQLVHECRVLHRDLKSANVFLTANGDAKLGDFGLSRRMSTVSNVAETVCGTPYAMSPEEVHGEPYGCEADVWALGVVLYELLALQRPFAGPNVAVVVLQISSGDVDAAPVNASPHPAALIALASNRAMLAQKPKQRMTIPRLLRLLRLVHANGDGALGPDGGERPPHGRRPSAGESMAKVVAAAAAAVKAAMAGEEDPMEAAEAIERSQEFSFGVRHYQELPQAVRGWSAPHISDAFSKAHAALAEEDEIDEEALSRDPTATRDSALGEAPEPAEREPSPLDIEVNMI